MNEISTAGSAGVLLPNLDKLEWVLQTPEQKRAFMRQVLALTVAFLDHLRATADRILASPPPSPGGPHSLRKRCAAEFFGRDFWWSPLEGNPSVRVVSGGRDWDVSLTVAADTIRLELDEKRLVEDLMAVSHAKIGFSYGLSLAMALRYQQEIRAQRAEGRTVKFESSRAPDTWVTGFGCAIADQITGTGDAAAGLPGQSWIDGARYYAGASRKEKAEQGTLSQPREEMEYTVFQGGYATGLAIAAHGIEDARRLHKEWRKDELALIRATFPENAEAAVERDLLRQLDQEQSSEAFPSIEDIRRVRARQHK